MDKKISLKELLLSPTPIGHRMLIAAWDDLSFESQSAILLEYCQIDGPRLNEHWKELADKALRSPSPVIRYLGSKTVGNKAEHCEFVRSDSDPLVASSNMIFGCDYFFRIPDISSFISLSQSERIEKLSYCISSGGKFFDLMASLTNETSKGKISKTEVYEILFAYLTNPYVKRDLENRDYKPDEGWTAFSDSKERDSLWKLILLFPEDWSLPQFLPATPNSEKISTLKEVVDKLIRGKYWQTLQAIFDREDIKENELRKSLEKECMQAVTRKEENSFFNIVKYDAIGLLKSLRNNDQTWDDIYEEINDYFDEDGD